MDNEIWKPIPDYEEIYQISNKGRVKKQKNGKTVYLKKTLKRDNYFCVFLNNGKKVKQFQIHRLLMIVFRPIKNASEMTVNHKDGVKGNNELSNLEWCTNKENLLHARKIGLFKRKNGISKLNEFEIILIKEALSKGVRQQTLADALAVTQAAISDVKRNITHKEEN